jgi:hypothetical protein
MRDPARHPHQVKRAFPKDLIRDVQIAAARIACTWYIHRSSVRRTKIARFTQPHPLQSECLQMTTERSDIEAAAAAYFESWFDGDGDRMAQVLHQDLSKKRAGEPLTLITRVQMVEATTEGAGTEQGGDRSIDIQILDIHGDIASVRVRSTLYYEYLHLVRTGDGWKIANTLYERS